MSEKFRVADTQNKISCLLESLTEDQAAEVIQEYIDNHAVKGYCRT